MKNNLLTFSLIALFLSSCSIVKVSVGGVSPDEPTVEVGSQRNHFFLYGLVRGGKNDLQAEKFIGDRDQYIIKTKTTFVNGLVAALTWNIYTPTTTSFHVPMRYLDNNTRSAYKEPNTKQKGSAFLNETVGDEFSDPINRQIDNTPYSDQFNSEQQRPNEYFSKKALDNVESTDVYSDRKEPSRTANERTNNTAVQAKTVRSDVNTSPAKQQANLSDGYKAAVYFKNGAKMNGQVYEQNSGSIIVKFSNGVTKELNMKDLIKIERL